MLDKRSLSSTFDLEMEISALIGSRNYSAAVEKYKVLYEKKGSCDPFSLKGIAFCYEQMKDYGMAIKYAEDALKIDPNNFAALQVLSRVCIKQNNHLAAYKYVIKALKNMPPSEKTPWYILALIKLAAFVPGLKDAEASFKGASSANRDWEIWAKKYVEWYRSNMPANDDENRA